MNDTACPIDEVYKNVFFIYVLGIGPVTLIGPVLNILTIVIIQRLKKDSTSLYLLQVLAICDTFFLAVCFVYFPFRHIHVYALQGDLPFRVDDWSIGGRVLRVIDPMFYVGATIRNWVVAIITIERLIHIMMPFKARTMITKSRLRNLVIFLFVISNTLQVHRYFIHILIPVVNPCTGQDDVQMSTYKHLRYVHGIQNLIYATASVLLPYAVIFVCNIVLLTSLRRSSDKAAEMRGQPNDKSHREATLMVVGMIVVFTLCETLGVVDRSLTYAGYNLDVDMVTMNYTRKLSLFLTILNSGVNFIAYVLMNRPFRQQFLVMLGFQPPKSGKQSGTSSSNTASTKA